MSGRVKYYSDGSKLIVSFTDIAQWGETSRLNFQIVIYKNGHIDINYAGMTGDRNTATIGIQNSEGTVAQEVIFNDSYLHNFLGLSFEQSPKWFTIDEQNYIQSTQLFESINHNFQINSNQIDNGIYSTCSHRIKCYRSNYNSCRCSIWLSIQYWDVNFDQTINVQDVVLLISIMLNTYPPNLSRI